MMAVIDCVEGKRKEAKGELGVAAIFVQEHWQKEDAIADLQIACKRKGWTAHGAAATTGPQGGASAGTAVLAPTRTAPSNLGGYEADCSPNGEASRRLGDTASGQEVRTKATL